MFKNVIALDPSASQKENRLETFMVLMMLVLILYLLRK